MTLFHFISLWNWASFLWPLTMQVSSLTNHLFTCCFSLLFWIFSMIGQLPWLLHLEHFISKLLLLCLTLNIGWLVGKQGNQKLAYIKPQGAPETTLSSYFAGYWIQPSIPTHVSAPGRGVPYVVLNPRQWMSFGLVTIFLSGCASMLVIILVFVFLCSFFLDF